MRVSLFQSHSSVPARLNAHKQLNKLAGGSVASITPFVPKWWCSRPEQNREVGVVKDTLGYWEREPMWEAYAGVGRNKDASEHEQSFSGPSQPPLCREAPVAGVFPPRRSRRWSLSLRRLHRTVRTRCIRTDLAFSHSLCLQYPTLIWYNPQYPIQFLPYQTHSHK